MSEFHRQQAFGPPTFIDVSASGSSSGLDRFDDIDSGPFYPESNFRALPHPLEVQQDGYAHAQFPYPSHSTNGSLPGLHFTSPAMAGHAVPHQYDHEPSILEELNGFSPIAPNFSMNTYRTPYPDSNASATSSATSPDPNPANLITDPVIIEADEDKRKRNQAASARFRQKKKQREQQLLESSRDMQDRMKKLEGENEDLKKENQFLKKLLVEKVDHMGEEDRDMLRRIASETLKPKK